jgi:hypothetical protein
MYFPFSEEVVDVLVAKTQSQNRHFFRILTAYHLSKIASMMRVNIQTKDRGVIPVNTYALNLMPSGAGKGFSTNLIEAICEPFKFKFLSHVFPTQSKAHLTMLAAKKKKALQVAMPNKTISDKEVLERYEKEFDELGVLAFSFDSGTAPAVKQMRQKLLLANAGSMNLELDEVGSNITNNVDIMNVFLELYDVGKIKQKLIKNTAENKRMEEIDGLTPTNMLLFGTPTKLLDGSKTEDDFMQMLETGYARRLLFGYDTAIHKDLSLTAEERYAALTDSNMNALGKQVTDQIGKLADNALFNRVLTISEENTKYLIHYQIGCERKAATLRDHQEIHKAELSHRYYKALKLAGAYAFADMTMEISKDHLDCAIQLVEDSGEAFDRLMAKEGPYVRLAKYLSNIGREVTQVDLVEELPFYKGNEGQKRELMNLAIAHGYHNNIIIRKKLREGIEFFEGESLQEVELDKLHVAYSTDITHNFKADVARFDQLHKMTCAKGIHYTAHSFENGHRAGDNALPGFDLVILDIDHGIQISTVQTLLQEYSYLIATTKRHTEENPRFRLILPMSHYLKLDKKDYSEFMTNIFKWVPFEVDEATKDIARKWEGFNGDHYYNQGATLDVTQFIPQTKRAEDRSNTMMNQEALTNMERWFFNNIQVGNRATMLFRFGCVLSDQGLSLAEVSTKVHAFNKQLTHPLSEEEITNTTIVSLAKKTQGP